MIKTNVNIFKNFKKINNYHFLDYNCWSCKKELSEKEMKGFFCPCEKNIILPVNEQKTYFEAFDMQPKYDIDKKDLTKRYRDLMRKLHPDLFTLKTDLEKKYSADQASFVNKCYSVLNNPIARGLYLLKLNNVNFEKETTHIGNELDTEKKEILMHVLELNEQIDEIESPKEVEELESKLYNYIWPLKLQLKDAFQAKNYEQAVRILTKMKYYQNIDERLKELKLKFNLNE